MPAQVSIRRKLRLVIMLTSAVALTLTAASFAAYEWFTSRRTLEEYVRAVGSIISANSTAALLFRNSEDASETLANLSLERYIVAGAIYDEMGERFAHWPAANTNFPARPSEDGMVYKGAGLVVYQPITQGGSRIGTLFMQVDLQPLYARFRLYAIIVVGVLLTSLIVAFLLANWLMRNISGPITALATTAKRVSIEHDYSVRAQRQTNDELGTLTDAFNHMLTQIHEQDEALRENQERLRLALEASSTGTWDLSLKTRVLRGDSYMQPLLGLPAGAFSGSLEQMVSYIHPDDRAGFLRLLDRAIESRKDFSAQFRVLRADGATRHLASRGRAFYEESGKPLRMTGVVIDITDAQEAAQALRESEERFRSMADAAPVLIWVGGAENQRTYFNRRWLEFTGSTFEQQIGKGWLNAVHPSDRAQVQRESGDLTPKHEPFTREYRLRRHDGEFRWVLETGVPRFTAEEKFIGVIGSAIDITDLKLAEAELERRVQERTAELAQTNHELESFTYSVSHDLRAPLRHIDGYAQILQEDYSEQLSPDASKYLARIRQGTKRMGQLVDDLLNLSRVSRGGITVADVNLSDLVEEVVDEMRLETGNRQIDWRIAPLPVVAGDPGLLKQVFTNLLANAVKYSRPRQVAIIEVGITANSDGQPTLYVRDNGVGFNMKFAHKLFGVFQRLHRPDEFEGTGVGLATVDRIIRKHGGRIWVEAELDKGATFYFTLGSLSASSKAA